MQLMRILGPARAVVAVVLLGTGHLGMPGKGGWPGQQTEVARGWAPPRCLSSPGWLEKDMNKGLGSSLKGEQASSGARPNYPPRGDTTLKVTV